MADNPLITAHGTLAENGDTWFLMAPDRLILLDVPFAVEAGLAHNHVSVSGRMGSPPDAPGLVELLAERIVAHEAIARRAFAICNAGAGASPDENWFRAERELLGLPMGSQPGP